MFSLSTLKDLTNTSYFICNLRSYPFSFVSSLNSSPFRSLSVSSLKVLTCSISRFYLPTRQDSPSCSTGHCRQWIVNKRVGSCPRASVHFQNWLYRLWFRCFVTVNEIVSNNKTFKFSNLCQWCFCGQAFGYLWISGQVLICLTVWTVTEVQIHLNKIIEQAVECGDLPGPSSTVISKFQFR